MKASKYRKIGEKGLFVNEGKIVDASFVEVPRQRNTKEEQHKIENALSLRTRFWLCNQQYG